MEMVNVVLEMVEKANGNWLLMLGVGVFLSVYVLKKSNILPTKILAGVSVLIGIVIGIFVTWMTGNDVLIGAYDGFLAGLIASGGNDLIQLIAAIMTGRIRNWNDVSDLLDDGKMNGSYNPEDHLK